MAQMPQETASRQKQSPIGEDTGTQSVFIGDLGTVKVYKKKVPDEEILYDVNVNELEKTPEDYYLNVEPQAKLLKAMEHVSNYFSYGQEAMKLFAVAPDVALGLSDDIKPEELAKVAKTWHELWQESPIGSKLSISKSAPEFLQKHQFLSFFPWYLAEYMPAELANWGTRPSGWLLSYGVQQAAQKFGPPLINQVLNKLPPKAREILLKNHWAEGMRLVKDYQKLGLHPNATTTQVKEAFRSAALRLHPDRGGSKAAFQELSAAYENILKSRGGIIDGLFELFRKKPLRIPNLTSKAGQADLVPNFEPGDLVKFGKDTAKVVKVLGEKVLINAAGKNVEVALNKIKPHPDSPMGKMMAELKDLDKMKKMADGGKLTSAKSKDIETFSKKISEGKPLTDLQKMKYESAKKEYAEASAKPKREPEKAPAKKAEATPPTAEPEKPVAKDVQKSEVAGRAVHVDKKIDGLGLQHYYGDNGVAVIGGMRTPGISSSGSTSKLYYTLWDSTVEGGKQIGVADLVYDHDKETIVGITKLDISEEARGLGYGRKIVDLIRSISPEEKISVYDIKSKATGFWKKTGATIKQPQGVRTFGAGNDAAGSKKPVKKYLLQTDAEYPSLSSEASQSTVEPKNKSSVTPPPPPVELPPPAPAAAPEPEPKKPMAINPKNIDLSEEKIAEATEQLKDQLENQAGKPLTHAEVLEAAKKADVLSSGVSREATLKFEAELLRTRQQLAELGKNPQITPEFLRTFRTVANTATDIARSLESMKIKAEGVPAWEGVRDDILKDLMKLGKTDEELAKAAEGVDFTNPEQAASFYHQFVKPTLGQIFDEYAYMNILSSPITHIVNMSSNVMQGTVYPILEKMAVGRFNQVVPYIENYVKAFPKAMSSAMDIMHGRAFIERPDVDRLPTQNKWTNWLTLGAGKYILRGLEAMDVLSRMMAYEGQKAALLADFKGEPTALQMADVESKAKAFSLQSVYRQVLDPRNETGQGYLLSFIDQITQGVQMLRRAEIDHRWLDWINMRWLIRFTMTPVNILKKGITTSPMGPLTMPGATDKMDKLGETILGTAVFIAGLLAANKGRMTWAMPKDANDRKMAYDAGIQPYSINVAPDDKDPIWVSYSALGKMIVPLAMAAGLHYQWEEDTLALSDNDWEKSAKFASGMMKFFGEQSYLEGIGRIFRAMDDDPQALAQLVSTPGEQMIPLSSLQGWVNTIIDPNYRKPKKGLSIETVTDNLQKKIVGASQFVPPAKDMVGKPQENQDRFINMLNPFRIKRGNKQKTDMYNKVRAAKRKVAKMRKDAEEKLEQRMSAND